MNIHQLKNSNKLDSSFEKRNQPILIKNFLRYYNLQEKLTFDKLKKNYGLEKVYVGRSKNGIYKLDPKSGGLSSGTVEMRLDEYLRKIEKKNNGEYYLQQAPLEKIFPAIFQELGLNSIIELDSPYQPNVWIGPKGTVVHLHFDWSNNFYLQIEGRKRFILYPPHHTKYLYPYTKKTKIPHVSQVDIHTPDLKSFPKFINAKSITFELNRGDVLYIPPFWWHQVYGESKSISISIWWPIKLKQIPFSMYSYLFHNLLNTFILDKLKNISSRLHKLLR